MGGKSSKKQAGRNEVYLKRLHLTVGVVLIGTILGRWISGKGHWIRFMLMNMVMIWCEYVLEKSGRPIYDGESGKLIKEGTDLSQEGGLTEYMFDVIYLSLFANVGTVLIGTDKMWMIMVVCPGYVGYKMYGFFGGRIGAQKAQKVQVGNDDAVEAKSKRQMKRERNSGKMQMKYRR